MIYNNEKKSSRIEAAIEGILFAAGEPVEEKVLASAIDCPPDIIEEALKGLKKRYERADSGIRLVQINREWQLSTKPDLYDVISKVLQIQETTGLSKAALETLSIIAYRQPVTRIDVDNIRGVSSNSSVQKLLDRGIISEAGRLNAPGRPILYKTTPAFLRLVNLRSIDELPSYEAYSESIPGENLEIPTIEAISAETGIQSSLFEGEE